MTQVLNLSFYRFGQLPQTLSELRQEFQRFTRALDLKGSILLSPEGINGFVAGQVDAVREFQEFARAKTGWLDLEFKESASPSKPFNRMLVKIKREIISLGMEDVRPELKTGKRLTAQELRAWLDSGRDVTLVDTRNAYETKLGTFEGAWDPGIHTFREFPEKLRQRIASEPELKKRPVVMFCTGGIRCEKATVVGMKLGLEDVYQLDGGILRYFEHEGGAHWNGECFVFDQRVALKPDLSPGSALQCFNCRTPLNTMDVESPKYVYEKSCPYCA